ncbi:MAG TPA: rhodanese-like domain-containing protein [Candidatus Sumerlaeota bacterium]|nr:rhodanese-like domain-containing protein [Candidatus Sumerlaeota bacterium]
MMPPAGRIAVQAAVLLLLAAAAAAIHRTRVEEAPRIVLQAEETRPAADGVTTPTQTAAATPGGETGGAPAAEAGEGISVVGVVTPERALELYNTDYVQFVDARNPADYAAGHLPGAVNLPFGEFGRGKPGNLDELIPEAMTIVYCEGGECESSRLVAQQLVMLGFVDVKIIEVGYPGWVAAGLPVESGDSSTGANR